MPAPNFVRGAVLKCSFPYDTDPSQPGPLPHYCLYIDSVELDGERYVALCYGTSRLDGALLRAHSGAILSVSRAFIAGPMPGDVTHFLCTHVAIVSQAWIYPRFNARLDFIRAERRHADPVRARLYREFEAVEPAMQAAAASAARACLASGKVGLPPGKKLR